MTNRTGPPSSLSAESQRPRTSVLAEHELERRHEIVLETALEALDRTCQAQAQLAEDGLTTVDGYGRVKALPCVGIE